MKRTSSEAIFELFCERHELTVDRVPEAERRTPDYRLTHAGEVTYFEIKQIDDDLNFRAPVMSRTPGDHLRAKIDTARGQVRTVADAGNRAVLLVMNALDPLQLFGTEPTDYWAAMHGDLSVDVRPDGSVSELYRGRNSSFRPDKNFNFSGLGLIRRTTNGADIVIYANPHARWPLNDGCLPEAFQIIRE